MSEDEGMEELVSEEMLWDRIPEVHGEERANTYYELSARIFARGQYDEALALAETARDIFSELGAAAPSEGLAQAYSAIGSQLKDEDSALHHYTGIIGLTVSGTFLMIIAILNLMILFSIVGVFFQMRKGLYNEEELEKHLNSRGLLMRFFGPIARRIDKSWKMYPLGILFGLGFDTATEIGLLVLAGSSVIAGLPWWAIISLPLFFAGRRLQQSKRESSSLKWR